VTSALPAGRETAADPLAVLVLVLGWLAGQRSVHTRRAYGRDIAGWLGWCTAQGTDPLAAVEADAAGWARRLEAEGLAAVSSWYSWLIRNGHATANPAGWLARPEVDRDASSTPGLTRDQALALLAAADSARGPRCARTSALVAVLLFTGARVSEVTGADIEDLGTDRGHRVLRVTRKGGRRQALGLPAPAAERLDAYLATRGDVESLPAPPGQPGPPWPRRALFATGHGGRLFPADVWQLVRRLGKAAGLPVGLVSHLGPHAVRHAFATLYLDAGGSLRTCRTRWATRTRARHVAMTAPATALTARQATGSAPTSPRRHRALSVGLREFCASASRRVCGLQHLIDQGGELLNALPASPIRHCVPEDIPTGERHTGSLQASEAGGHDLPRRLVPPSVIPGPQDVLKLFYQLQWPVVWGDLTGQQVFGTCLLRPSGQNVPLGAVAVVAMQSHVDTPLQDAYRGLCGSPRGVGDHVHRRIAHQDGASRS